MTEPRSQAQLRKELRIEFLTHVPLLAAEEVGDILGIEPDGVRLLREKGRLLAVSVGDDDLYPAFQLSGGSVRPEIAEVRSVFGEDSEWVVALWFYSPSGWLGGRRPMDVLEEDPARVLETARKVAAPLEI